MQLKCRSIEAELTGIALLTCINTFVIVFFIYMSVKFSQPVRAQWQRFIEKAQALDGEEQEIEFQTHSQIESSQFMDTELKILDALSEQYTCKDSERLIHSYDATS